MPQRVGWQFIGHIVRTVRVDGDMALLSALSPDATARLSVYTIAL
jgi:hypothetical protein